MTFVKMTESDVLFADTINLLGFGNSPDKRTATFANYEYECDEGSNLIVWIKINSGITAH